MNWTMNWTNGRMSRTCAVLALAVSAGSALAQLEPARRLPNGEIAQPADERPRPAPEGPHPKIEFETRQVDFGTIFDDKLTDPAEIRFKNTGDETLIISDVKSSCGCTQPVLERREYAPGESGVMTVQFKPQNKSGRNQQFVTVVSNDPTAPAAGARIDVTATVRPIVSVEPALVNFSAVRKGEILSAIVTVTGIGEDFEVTEASTIGNPSITAEILGAESITDEDGRPMRRFEIEIFSDGTAKPGFLRSSLQVFTNHPLRKSVTASISGQVLGDIAVSEPQLRLGAIEVGEAFTRTMTIRSRTGAPFAITDISENSNLPSKVDWEVAATGKETSTESGPISDEYKLTLKFPPVERPGGLRGTMTLHTSLEDEKRVQFLYFGTVRPDASAAAQGTVGPAAPTAPTTTTKGSPGRGGDAGDR